MQKNEIKQSVNRKSEPVPIRFRFSEAESELPGRIKECLSSTSVADFARRCGIGESLIRKYIAGSMPSAINLARIAAAAGVSIEWLATGLGPKWAKDLDRPLPGSRCDDFDLIPFVGVELSAGGGTWVYEEDVAGFLAFRKDWIHTITTSPKSLVLMNVRGDSMAPTIQNGDTVMIDASRRMIHPGDVYAIRTGGTVSIKRLDILPGGRVRVLSVNLQYPPYEVDAEALDVLGKVIWFARKLAA